jgi:rhodanese-related sulfurtransferase/DNA-binding HxlR family transcriptional regulator
MADRAAKDALYDGFALVAKAFASGRRAEIIDVLQQGERSVEDLAAAIEQSTANTSQHLRQLSHAGLVRGRRDGSRIIYSLTSPEVGQAWATLSALAVDHHADMKRLVADYLGDRDGLETIGRAELAKRLRRNDVIVLDVRPEAEFRAGHIEGARPISPSELAQRLAELPDDREIVAYCRGPYCVYADEAVRTLVARGRRARRLEGGFPEWARAGLPVATGPR